MLAAIARVDDEQAVLRQHLADHVRDELRLNRLSGVFHQSLQLRLPFGARFRYVDPCFSQFRFRRALGETLDEAFSRAGNAERDRKHDADLAGRRAVMHELRVRVEDAVFVHRREHVDVRADRDDEIGLGHDAIRAAEAAAAERTQRQRMRRRQCIRRILQSADRNARHFGERSHGRTHLFADDAAADDKHRLLRGGEQFVHLIELLVRARGQNGIAISGRRRGFGRAMLEQHFARRFDMRRPLRLGQRDAKRAAHALLHLIDVRNAVGPLRDRLHERDLVHVLGRIPFAHDAFLYAANADYGHQSALRGAYPGREIRDTRPFGRRDHCRPHARARKTVRHECGALFVARQDKAYLRRVAQRVDDREILRTGYAEYVIDAFAQQRVDQRARAGDRTDRIFFRGIHRNAAPLVGCS